MCVDLSATMRIATHDLSCKGSIVVPTVQQDAMLLTHFGAQVNKCPVAKLKERMNSGLRSSANTRIN